MLFLNELLCLRVVQLTVFIKRLRGIRDHHCGLIEGGHLLSDENLAQPAWRSADAPVWMPISVCACPEQATIEGGFAQTANDAKSNDFVHTLSS